MSAINGKDKSRSNPPVKSDGARCEPLEDRRMMSSVANSAAQPVNDRSAYEFELGRPGEAFTGITATTFGAEVADAASFDLPLAPIGLARSVVEKDGVSGSYGPRVKLWGHTRINPSAQRGTDANPFSSAMTIGDAGRPPNARHFSSPLPLRHQMLIVEDDPGSRAALKTILQRRGWEVTAVGTLAEGMRELSHSPEAVILDLGLPDGDGETLLRQIHDQHLPTCVAVTTGTNDADRLKSMEELGANAVLVKPVNLAALLQGLPHLPQTEYSALAA